MLRSKDILEIRSAFDAFDEERLGRLSTHKTTILCCALGFKLTQAQVTREIYSLSSMREKVMGCNHRFSLRRNGIAPSQERIRYLEEIHGGLNSGENDNCENLDCIDRNSVLVDFEMVCQLLEDKVRFNGVVEFFVRLMSVKMIVDS